MKTKNFLKMAFLLLALVGGVNSVWADPVYKGDFTNNQIIWLSTTNVDAAIAASWIAKNTTATGSISGQTEPTTGDGITVYRIKSWKDKHIDFYVTGVSAITFYAHNPNGTSSRTMKATVNETSKEQNAVTLCTINTNDGGSSWGNGTVELTAAANNFIRVYADADLDLYAMKVTVPAATEAPTITSNLASSADVYVGVAHDFSITATGATSYQWYKASSTTADIENDDAIDGATSSTYSYTAASTGTEYLYCAATNAIGSTLSTVCAVTATSATFHSVTYNLGDATGGTVPTQANVAEGNTFTVAAAPGDLVAPSGKEFKCWNDGADDYNAGATYTMGDENVTLTAVYQDRVFEGLTPVSTLNLSDATSTTFTTIWFDNAGKMDKNYYYDALNGRVIMSAYAIYQGKNHGNVTWMATDSGNSSSGTWDATGVFKGSSYYFNAEERTANIQQTARIHYYRVTNCTGVSALTNGKSHMAAYEVNAGVVSPDPVDGKTSTISEAGTLSITGLDKDKEYVILVRGNNGSSGIRFYEIAFFFPAVTSVSGTITPAGWSTFASSYPLDLSTISGGAAYYASAASGSTVTLSTTTATVPAGEGIMVKGTAGETFTINVAASGTEIDGNLLKGQTTTGNVAASTSGTYHYVFGYKTSDAKEYGFYNLTADTSVPAGKAYLETKTELTGARIAMIFDDEESTGINNVKREEISSNRFYNLNGLEVAQPTKGLYIVNGKKVVIK